MSILETTLQEFQPPESGFVIKSISKGKTEYLKGLVIDLDHELLDVTDDQGPLITHHPSQLWGYDNDSLIIGVVARDAASAYYTWYRDGKMYKGGSHLSCLAVHEEGTYTVKVRCDQEEETSEEVLVKRRPESENVPYGVPFIERGDLQFDSKRDEIGRGTFGAVYKAMWAGTAVAVKQMKVRNVNLIKSVLQSEVHIHSKIRHPNIVQIMAVALAKTAVYIVCELVDGANLEELLFSDEEDGGASFCIPIDKKPFIGKQIVQAVAYLHNLKPPILHRDIKPANVLVSRESYLTKLCDMGLGKVKSAQTNARVTVAGVPGTPNYMAPECLLERKKATSKSDVWSLGCTLVELFSGKDCWGQLVGAESDDQGCEAIYNCLKGKEIPRAIKELNANELKIILTRCFDYDIELRPNAIDLLPFFS